MSLETEIEGNSIVAEGGVVNRLDLEPNFEKTFTVPPESSGQRAHFENKWTAWKRLIAEFGFQGKIDFNPLGVSLTSPCSSSIFSASNSALSTKALPVCV